MRAATTPSASSPPTGQPLRKGAFMCPPGVSIPQPPRAKTSLSASHVRIRFAPALVLLFPLVSSATVTNQFLRLTSYPTGGTPNRTATADFNRDGKTDIVALNSNGVLSVLLGSGTGTFAAPRTVATLPSSAASALIAAADFNGDGDPDILLLPSPGNAVKVYRGHGDGTFAPPVSIADGLPSAGALAMGDFNNDGRQDIVVAGTSAVSILLGVGSGI